MTNEAKMTTNPASPELTDAEMALVVGGDKARAQCVRDHKNEAIMNFNMGDFFGGLHELSAMRRC
jgi:hypothetical protein